MTLLVSLASYMYILASLHTHTSFTIATVHFLTLPSRLGVQGTVYHLFHCALLHSAEDKWTIFDSQITDLGDSLVWDSTASLTMLLCIERTLPACNVHCMPSFTLFNKSVSQP